MRTGTIVVLVAGAAAVSVGAVLLLRKPAVNPPATATRPNTSGTATGWLGALDAVAAAAPAVASIVKTFSGGSPKPTTPSEASADSYYAAYANNPLAMFG